MVSSRWFQICNLVSNSPYKEDLATDLKLSAKQVRKVLHYLEARRCSKLDPSLKAHPVSNFDGEKMIAVLST